ncbi:LysR family transcriptional regulator [Pseudomonas sp. NPDC089569]|uniref:LysR family transcriptional regulator n=1 Tax=Pseudomonas sp. NPDC089569 TaxID=3390722 RepID=UPI003D06827C
MIELRQLRNFLALAEHLHFSKAATAVHLTQPSLSRQIAALEAELGVMLFARHSRAVTLTAAGLDFQAHAKSVVAALELAIRSTRASARGERGELRVSFTSVAAWTLMPALIKRYTDTFPEVRLELNELLPKDMEKAVTTGDTDLALTFKVSDEENSCYFPLHDEPLCIALPADHPQATADAFDVGQLKDAPFILSPRTIAPLLHDTVLAYCRRSGFEPRIRIQPHLQQTIVNLVAEGMGVSVVPLAMRKMQIPGVIFKPIPQAPSVEFGIVWNRQNDNPCLVSFLRHVGACAAETHSDTSALA